MIMLIISQLTIDSRILITMACIAFVYFITIAVFCLWMVVLSSLYAASIIEIAKDKTIAKIRNKQKRKKISYSKQVNNQSINLRHFE